jgi:protocatechuate 3,4-dioxygenase beta subunit
MNRGILISLLVVAVAATAAVLFFPGGEPSSLDPLAVENDDQATGKADIDSATLDPNGSRTASQNQVDPNQALEADPTTIVGVVRSSDTGKPLPKARLVYSHRQFGGAGAGWSPTAVRSIGDHCDKNARFQMSPAGRHDVLEIVAWAPGYSVGRYPDLKLGDVLEIDLQPSVVVTGTVVDPQGHPAVQTKVKLFDPSHALDGYPLTGVTDENGNFKIAASQKAGVSLEVRSGAGTALLDRSLDVKEDMEPVRVILGGNLSLTGSVADGMGRAVAGAKLSLKKSGQRIATDAVSDEEGKVLVYGLESGEWTCLVSGGGFAEQTHKVMISSGNPASLHVVLVRNSSLRVTALDGKNRPLKGAVLQLVSDPRGEYSALRFPPENTDADGVAIFPQVPPGRYVIGPENRAGQSLTVLFELEGERAGGKGTATFSKLIDVLPGQESKVELMLKRHGVLTVAVRRNGEAVIGARGRLIEVSTSKKRKRDAEDLSNLDGELVFPAVWMGDYVLEVQGAPSEAAVRREITCGRGVNTYQVDLPAGSVAGTVLAAGKPVAGADLAVALLGQDYVSMAHTAADGTFLLTGFEAGNYKMRISTAEHLPWELQDLQHDGSQVDLGTITLESSCRLTGKVTGLKPSANDFLGPIIHALDLQGNALATRPINQNGTFLFESLPTGAVRLKVVTGGREIHGQTVQLPLSNDSLLIEL